jgi:hypothetical protein
MSNSTIKVNFIYNENSLTCDHGIYPQFPVGWIRMNIEHNNNNNVLDEVYSGPKEFQYEMKLLLTRKFNELVLKKIIKSYKIMYSQKRKNITKIEDFHL